MSAGLRAALEQAMTEQGASMSALTVLAAQNDPYRVDTPAGHRDGGWLAVQAEKLHGRKIHLRGLHYMVLGEIKPNGSPYTNTDADWLWLQATAAKAARWLGYVPFDQIIDARNADPVVRIHQPIEPSARITAGVELTIPEPEDFEPQVAVDGFEGIQPYKLVIFGEKTSLEDVVAPIASAYHADLYLPAGEISDTLLHRMARIGAEDGRPMIVFTISDCDPAGWQMPVSIGRKLQAFRDLLFPELAFQVRPIALKPEHVREYGLPSTPLKDTEKRGDKWTQAMGVEQTEIDAIGTLRPDVLRKIVRHAIDPFFDGKLAERVSQARSAWLLQAQAALEASLDDAALAQIRFGVTERLADVREELDAINDAMAAEVPSGISLPPIVIPEAAVDETVHGLPLVDSEWSLARQSRTLIAHKAYENGAS